MSYPFYEAMHEVLQTSRYDRLMGRRSPWRTGILRRLAELLERLFSNIDFDSELTIDHVDYNLSAIPIVFMIIGIILLVVAAVVIIRAIRRSRLVDYYDLSDIFEELARNSYSVEDLIELSDSADDRRIAIRYRYIAALLALNEKQIIEIRPSATNAIILTQIRESSPTLAPVFDCAADAFQRAWFGYKNISDVAYQDFANAVDSILQSGDELA